MRKRTPPIPFAGLAAWMLDHHARSEEFIVRVNVSLYWFTNTAVSSARLYREASQNPTGGFFSV